MDVTQLILIFTEGLFYGRFYLESIFLENNGQVQIVCIRRDGIDWRASKTIINDDTQKKKARWRAGRQVSDGWCGWCGFILFSQSEQKYHMWGDLSTRKFW